jgi:indolepyruvate ferredoxin oxidoreductase beta subunit
MLGALIGTGATAVTEKVMKDIIAGSTKKAFLDSNLKAFDLGKEAAQKVMKG